MSETTEFKITSDLAAVRDQEISANFEEVRAWLVRELEPYRSLIVSEDAIPAAKGYRANIRKVKDRIEQYRKEAKSAALAPYNAFEARCKELTGLCDEAAGSIDGQIKSFEQREREEKIAALQAVYEREADEETASYCPWERVFNERWGNKGYAFDAASAEIAAKLDKVRGDLSVIREVGGEDTAYLLDVYRRTMDISAVVRKGSELKTLRELEAARKREAQRTTPLSHAERDSSSQGASQDIPLSVAGGDSSPQGESQEARESQEAGESQGRGNPQSAYADSSLLRKGAAPYGREAEEEMLRVVDFRIWASQRQLAALRSFLMENGIQYGRVPKEAY